MALVNLMNNRYKVLRKLVKGAEADVFLVEDTNENKKV
jgi:hypothetical protein